MSNRILIVFVFSASVLSGWAVDTPATSPRIVNNDPDVSTITLNTTSDSTNRRIQGIAYSPFRDCQHPYGTIGPSRIEVLQDLEILSNAANAIRTYSTDQLGRLIAHEAHRKGLRVSAGAWLGSDPEANEEQIKGLIALAREIPLESVIVGNEVLHFNRLSLDELISYIRRVRAAVDVPVTTALIPKTESEEDLRGINRLVNELDYMLVHFYPFWAGSDIEGAANSVVEAVEHLRGIYSKPIIIGETGWPSAGPPQTSRGHTQTIAEPTPKNHRRYLREFLAAAKKSDVGFYYFSAFDELWKSGEGGVGQFWGIWNANRQPKHDIVSVLNVPPEIPPAGLQLESEIRYSNFLGDAFFYTAQGVKKAGGIVYENYASERHMFAPSASLGHADSIRVEPCSETAEGWNSRAIKISYFPDAQDPIGWSGIQWLPSEMSPNSRWGEDPDIRIDLDGAKRLRLKAWSSRDGVRAKFLIGGIKSGRYPGSIGTARLVQGADAAGFVELTRDPREFVFDLQDADLSGVIGGFGVVTTKCENPEPAEIYLDDIAFDSILPGSPDVGDHDEFAIYTGVSLRHGLGISVDSKNHRYDWLISRCGSFEIRFPTDEDWGVVYLHVGDQPLPRGWRPSIDLSSYSTLEFELKGSKGGERLQVSVKDSSDPDNGFETKVAFKAERNWTSCAMPASSIGTASFEKVYVPIEFVFDGEYGAQTVFVRNIKYTRAAVGEASCQ